MRRFGERTRPSTQVATWLPPGAFNPLQLRPLIWVDASETSTITSSGSPAKVSQWNDRSGNGYHLSNAVAAGQPSTGTSTQNGRNVLEFDGGDRLQMSVNAPITGNSARTYFAVARYNASAADVVIAHGASSSGQAADLFIDRGADNAGFRGWAADPVIGFAIDTGTWVTIGLTYDGTSLGSTGAGGIGTGATYIYNGNGVAWNSYLFGNSASTLNTPSSLLSVGDLNASRGNEGLNGFIAEVMVFDYCLTATEMTTLHNYAKDKWGLT